MPEQRFIGVLPLHFSFLFSLLREAANSRVPYGSGTRNPLPGQAMERLTCHHEVVKSMTVMVSVVVERWGEMLIIVFIFQVKRVFLFLKLLLGVNFSTISCFFPSKKSKRQVSL